jgi:DNA-directed RNA polymerase subunit M/transcription elongation factor TFIIS
MRIRCPSCRATLNAPDSAAGKRARCPECRAEMQIPPAARRPDEEYEDFRDPADDLFSNLPAFEDPYATSPDDEKPCPSCAEPIPKRSRRCPYCGDDLEIPRPAKRRTKTKRKPTKEEILAKRGPGDSDLTAGDILLCVICSGLGCIMGLCLLISGDSKGGKMLALSLICDFAKAILFTAIRMAARGN